MIALARSDVSGLMYHCDKRDVAVSADNCPALIRMQERSCTLVRNRNVTNNHIGNRTEDVRPDSSDGHRCPWCGSQDTVFVQRGFVGPTDDRNQHLTCRRCNRLTYEIVSRTPRDMRLGQFQVGDFWRDSARQTKYVITRILKVGVNETLLYVKPVVRPEASELPQPGSH